MDADSACIPFGETPATPRAPLHLRYLSLLRTNVNLRRLWLAQLVSEIGDWFYVLAVYDLLLETTSSGKAVAWAIIIQLLPWSLLTPLTGAIVDRFSRRRLMILADVARACTVLGLLLVETAADVWMVYALLGLETVFASIFEPARSALLPNLAHADEILPANALSSATWSFCLAAGAPLGGMVAALWGRQVSFALNSASFLVSALLILRIASRETHLQSAASAHSPGAGSRPNELREGLEYFRQDPKVLVLALAKAGLGIFGGMHLLLAVFGKRVFPIAGHGALAMGLLYGARGAGAGVGPMLGDHLTGGHQSRMWKSLSISFFLMSLSYVFFSLSPALSLAVLAVFCAHMGASNIWVMSTSLLQLNTLDRFRGRVFAVDFGLHMLTASVSTYLVGVGLDSWELSPRQLAAGVGLLLALPGLLWLPAQAKWSREIESVNHRVIE